jgi:hypothetical protein
LYVGRCWSEQRCGSIEDHGPRTTETDELSLRKNASRSTIYAIGRSMTQSQQPIVPCVQGSDIMKMVDGKYTHFLDLIEIQQPPITLRHYSITRKHIHSWRHAGRAALPLQSLDLTMRSLAPYSSRIRISMPSHTTPHPTAQHGTPEIYLI